jgi:hypothetical protein
MKSHKVLPGKKILLYCVLKITFTEVTKQGGKPINIYSETLLGLV